MHKLIHGIIDFRKNRLLEYRQKFSKLAAFQSPDVLFIACCDSRVVPNTFASSDPGDLFVLRNIGNLVPPYCAQRYDNQQMELSVAATLEFSLRSLDVRDIIICGHSECGAMHTLLEDNKQTTSTLPQLNRWLAYAKSSYERLQNGSIQDSDLSPCNLLSRINVLQQMDNLKTYPIVLERLQNKQLQIHGWWFDLTTADIFYYDHSSQGFMLLDESAVQNDKWLNPVRCDHLVP